MADDEMTLISVRIPTRTCEALDDMARRQRDYGEDTHSDDLVRVALDEYLERRAKIGQSIKRAIDRMEPHELDRLEELLAQIRQAKRDNPNLTEQLQKLADLDI